MGPTRTRGTTESDRHLAGNAVLAVIVAVLAGCSSPPPKVAQHCPQPRFTGSAPEEYLNRSNPLRQERGAAAEGARLFGKVAGCAACHGDKGDGRGPLANGFQPPPRNFRCAQTVNGIADGQLFWIIRFGSPGTAMPAHPKLDDTQVWQIVSHLRELASGSLPGTQ